MDSSQYWAAAPTDEIGAHAAKRVEAFYRWCQSSALVRRMLLARRLIYGLENKAGATSWEVRKGGVRGELSKMRSDHFGDYAERRVTLATQQPPSWQPVATNSDHASLAQATTVSGVLDYYYREQRLDRHFEQALDDIQWGGEGFVFGGWDVNKGPAIAGDPETGEKVTEGDLFFKNLTALDVARDVYASTWAASPWKIARVPVNKWDLAARHPEKTDEILKIDRDWTDITGFRAEVSELESDEVFLFYLLHERTDALPEGRFVEFVSGNGVLFDGPMPFRDSPLMRAWESELRGTPFGWTAMFRCLGPQEVVDALTTAITTNQVAHAVNKIVGFKGSGLSYKQLTQALAYLEVKDPSQIPQVLNFSQTPGDVFQYRKDHIAEMGMFSGVNEIQRGIVNPAIKSGAHAALFDAIGNRNNSRLQRAHHVLAEDVGTFVIHVLADYAKDSQRVARIVGQQNQPLLIHFTGADLEGFDRVTVEAVNHALKTVVGKQTVADTLLQNGALGQGELAGQRYLQLAKTGDLDQMTEDPRADALRRKRDKELLAKGIGLAPLMPDVDELGRPVLDPMGMPSMSRQPQEGQEHVVVHMGQRHWLDIPEYLSVLSSPAAMADDNVVSVVLDVVQEKLNLWKTMDPDLLFLLQGPLPPSMQMAMQAAATPPPEDGKPSGTSPPKGGATSKTKNPAEITPSDLPAEQPGMPRLPGGDEYQPDSPEGLPIQ